MPSGPLVLSLEVALAATALSAIFGVPLAALLANRRFPGREILDALLSSPLVLPPTVLGYYLLVVLGRRTALGQLYESLTGSSIVFTRVGAVLAALVGALPIVVKAGRASLSAVDPVLLAAARTLGAGPLRAFFTVQLPLAGHGIAAALMLAFARSLGEFGVTLMVAGNIPDRTRTASMAIYDAIQAGRDEEALGFVVALSAIAIACLYGINTLASRRDVR